MATYFVKITISHVNCSAEAWWRPWSQHRWRDIVCSCRGSEWRTHWLRVSVTARTIKSLLLQTLC